ncbi:M24 family metallopeptidase [bacterium]|nr:MAG: M24 family metallopeptidase [bacterium]
MAGSMTSLATLALYLGVPGVIQGAAQETLPLLEADRISNSEHLARRAALKAWMPNGSVAVIFTNPERNRSNDTDFKFHPNADFWYLTGFPEPDAALVLAPDGMTIDGKRVTEVLLVNDRNPGAETWTGYRFGPATAAQRLGVEISVSNRRLAEVLAAAGSGAVFRSNGMNDPTGSILDMTGTVENWAKGRERLSGLSRQIGTMRAIKSPAEIGLLKKAVAATAVGHIEAIKSCEPGMKEYDLQAVVEYSFTRGGCEWVGYNSIVGGGPDSCVLHYEENRRTIRNGEIVCMDVAGEYHGYSADVTRSYPANGKFTPAQLAIYNLVLEAADAGIAACRPEAPFGASHRAAETVLRDGMLRLGIIKNASELRRYFMHGTSHTIGLDVHDSPVQTMKPGVALTVEPGIYIPAGSPCDPKWWNIGVRIEDDILITATGAINLSAGVPRKAAEIEALMKAKGIGNVKLG